MTIRNAQVEEITYMGCRYCDGASYSFPYGPSESCHCTSCGAEWDPVSITEEVEVSGCVDCGGQLGLFSMNNLCHRCEDERNREEELIEE